MIERSSVRGWSRSAALAVLTLASPGWLLAAAGETPTATAPASARILNAAESRLKADVGFLAADAREGRAPGTPGIEAAAAYIAGAFNTAGLKTAPGADGYFQPFTIHGQAKLGKAPSLAFSGPDGKSLVLDKGDFTPLAIGTGANLGNVPIVFAGYGISARDSIIKLDYDDYAGVDVKGKAVLLLRREPRQDRDDSPFDGKKDSFYATFRHKATNAFQQGAAAVLLVNDHAGLKAGKDELLGFSMAGPSPTSTIPFLMLTRAVADKLLAGAGEPTLAALEEEIDSDLKPRSRALKGWTLKAEVDIERTSIETKNVVGVLEGAGPLADETIVVGAHYDHLGRGGGLFSGSLAPFSKEIHNGADDNASGTSMLLELARRLTRRADPLPRRVVFIAFSGEERGLLGSQHYVDSPLFPLKNTVMMVNFDMVGRLNGKNELTLYGIGTSPGIEAIADALAKSEEFKLKKIASGYGPSDQQSFYVRDIPVLFAFTGTHSDYHRPSDDTDLINFGGMARIADFSELLLLDLARRPQRPGFIKVAGPPQGDPARSAVSVYLGSIPDYDEGTKGVKLNGVREGSPAEKGGLRKGDVIVKFGGKAVGTIYDYTDSLARYKPGDVVEVVVERDGKETTLKVTLGKKPTN
jgi:hypothetical protein